MIIMKIIFYFYVGLKDLKNFLLIDILEKLFIKILGNSKDRKFKVNSEMMNLLGCTKENFHKLMTYMGYKKKIIKIKIFIFLKDKKKKIRQIHQMGQK